jgi:hypothetical protein
MSADAQVQIATLIVGLLTVIVNGVLAYLMARLKQQQLEQADANNIRLDHAAVKVAEVKQSLAQSNQVADQKLDELKMVAVGTHELVNAKMGAVLQRLAEALERNARISGSAEDRQAADSAQADLKDHEAKQAIVDAQPGTDDQKKGRG